MSDSEHDYEESDNVAIIDNGSSTIKAGLGGVTEEGYLMNEEPQCIFPSIVGRPKWYGISHRDRAFSYGRRDLIDAYVGNEAIKKRALLKINSPVQNGNVTSWQDMQKIWDHTFYNQLRIEPMEHPVMMTEASLTPKADREKSTQIMFETFNVPSFYLANQSVMALYGHGHITGVLVNSGHEATRSVAVYEGYRLSHATSKLPIGGKHIDEYLHRLMRDRGHTFDTQSEKAILTDVKKKHGCFMPFDPDYKGSNRELKEKSNKAAAMRDMADDKGYELPDGQVISIGKERFEAAEVLFKPHLHGSECDGIHELVIETVEKCDIDLREELYETICIAGGNTMIDGFAERLKEELESDKTKISDKKGIKAMIKAPHDRLWATWRGCAVKASLRSFEEEVITKDEYDGTGPGIVHRKCF